MWIPGMETLVIKGFIHGAAWLGAHLSGAALVQAGSYVVAHGIIATTTALLTSPIVIGTSLIIGSVVWLQESTNKVNKIIEHLSNDEPEKVVEMVLSLWQEDKIGKSVDDTIGAIASLINEKYDYETAVEVSGEIRSIFSELQKISK